METEVTTDNVPVLSWTSPASAPTYDVFMDDEVDKLMSALAQFQMDCPSILKDKVNGGVQGGKAKYAAMDGIMDVVREPLHKNGLFVSHWPGTVDDNGVSVTVILMHKSGQKIVGKILMPFPKIGQNIKNDPHGVGSAIQYARRYSICAILGLAPDDDDDGNAASGKGQSVPHNWPTDDDIVNVLYLQRRLKRKQTVPHSKAEAAKWIAELKPLVDALPKTASEPSSTTA